MYDLSTAESASWALAADLAPHLHPDLVLSEEHPGGGLYDVLRFAAIPHAPAGLGQVLMNRSGSIHLQPAGPGRDLVPVVHEPWEVLANTSETLSRLRRFLLGELDADERSKDPSPWNLPRHVAARRTTYATIAGVLSLATAAGCRATCRWGVLDHAVDGRSVRKQLFVPYERATAAVDLSDASTGCAAERWWFVVDEPSGEPVLALTTDGGVVRPDQRLVHQLGGLTPKAHLQLALAFADEVITRLRHEMHLPPLSPLYHLLKVRHGLADASWLHRGSDADGDMHVMASAAEVDFHGWGLQSGPAPYGTPSLSGFSVQKAALLNPYINPFDRHALVWAAASNTRAPQALVSPQGRRYRL